MSTETYNPRASELRSQKLLVKKALCELRLKRFGELNNLNLNRTETTDSIQALEEVEKWFNGEIVAVGGKL